MEMPASSPFPVFNQTAQQSASSPQPVTETAAERQTRLAGYLAELSAPTKKPPRRLEKKYWSEKDVQFLGTSNISHHVTPRDVLPSFEDVAISNSIKVADLFEVVSKVRSLSRAELQRDNGYHIVEESEHRIIEEFKLHGYETIRIKYKHIDHKETASYDRCESARNVVRKLNKTLGSPPEKAVVQWAMAELLEGGYEHTGKKEGHQRRLQIAAHEHLWRRRERISEIRAASKHGPPSELFREKLEEAKSMSKRLDSSPFQQIERDAKAASDPTLLRPIEGKDLVVALDKHDVVVAVVIAQAIQTLYSKEVLSRLNESLDEWTYHAPVPCGAYTRHPLYKMDKGQKPQFDIEKADDPHQAKSGVQHYGCGGQVGHTNDAQGVYLSRSPGTTLVDYKFESTSQIHRLMADLARGAFGTLTRLVGEFFRRLDPDLYAQYKEVCRLIPQNVHLDTVPEGEIFTLRALLTNVSTQDHIDKSDWQHGVAAIIPFGDFEGGDLLFRQLGLRIPFGPGCFSMFRGRELRHSTTKWEGSSRSAVVHTIGEAVKIAAVQERAKRQVNAGEAASADAEARQEVWEDAVAQEGKSDVLNKSEQQTLPEEQAMSCADNIVPNTANASGSEEEGDQVFGYSCAYDQRYDSDDRLSTPSDDIEEPLHYGNVLDGVYDTDSSGPDEYDKDELSEGDSSKKGEDEAVHQDLIEGFAAGAVPSTAEDAVRSEVAVGLKRASSHSDDERSKRRKAEHS